MRSLLCVGAAAVLLLMCSCANGAEIPGSSPEYAQESAFAAASAQYDSKDNGGISYDSVIDRIESYYGRYISMNSEENEIFRAESDASGLSSEGGVTEVFRSNDNEPVRYRRSLYGSMGQTEENCYIMGDGGTYFTIMEKRYDTYHPERADTLYYAFSEYWIENGSVYLIDRAGCRLIICSESPVPKIFSEILE